MEGGDVFVIIVCIYWCFGMILLLVIIMIVLCEEIVDIFSQFGVYCCCLLEGGLWIFGVYLEGFYINFGKFGVQFNFVYVVVFEEVEDYLCCVLIWVIIIVFEIVGYWLLICVFVECGVCLQIGYILGSYEDGVVVLEVGVSSFIYFYNVMIGLYYCELGIVGVVLVYVCYVELIFDLLYVYFGVIRVVLCLILCLYCVIDFIVVVGMFDGQYKFGSYMVIKCLGGVCLFDGILVGSILIMDQVLCNLVKIGLFLVEVL